MQLDAPRKEENVGGLAVDYHAVPLFTSHTDVVHHGLKHM